MHKAQPPIRHQIREMADRIIERFHPERIILFGSHARGNAGADSDVDLFILAADRSQVMAAVSHSDFDRPVQPIIVNNQELAAMKQAEPAFYAQVQRGIVLWETTDELAA